MRVNNTTIEKIWSRLSQDLQPPFPLHMDDSDFTAIDLWGGLGEGHMLRSDGVVVRWELLDLSNTEIKIEPNPGWCVGALVMASERIPELKDVLPRRPEGAPDCDHCDGHGFTDLPGAPKFLLCQFWWGLGWRS